MKKAMGREMGKEFVWVVGQSSLFFNDIFLLLLILILFIVFFFLRFFPSFFTLTPVVYQFVGKMGVVGCIVVVRVAKASHT